ncbi:carbohydrate ABC transporter permease [Blautia sp. NSJ-159]|uniref:ABC transporter permease n=1 Tax=unclassified Blautia TaxID=2648079 RepID=UPI001FD5E87E|nr:MULTISPECIES: carbohydrate ABC transporter permease [unclassified Blautia]MCJ8019666.1 carbohydrate ABC transporter permease [Blautia sp. NSJ-159]MCJ8042356.1 carbohydrate ABC transporter permease [Blautia sp. NSJ-165]
MFKMLNPRRFYHAVGRRKFLEFVLLAVFVLFFYGPLLNMLMLAFANEYNVPHVLPEQWGIEWWGYVFGQESLVSSMIQSFIVAIATTIISMVFCIPAAYSIARFKYRGRKIFMLSFLLTNAFPKLGIYTSIAVLFYKYGLMGTYPGVIIIHMINSMMFMVWLPSNAFRNVHRQQEEAARDVGAGPIRAFFKVTFPMAMPGIAVATLYTFLGSMEEAQGTMLVGLARIQTMPVAMYGIVLDSSAVQIGAVFAILLIIPSAVMIILMRKFIGPEAIAGGFKMK